MTMLDLLTGTRRLRREIDAQAQQFERDIERVQLATTQLRATAVARITSPLALLGTAAAGFTAGKLASRPKRLGRRAIGSIAALTMSTARAIGLQVALPMAIEWAQTKLAKNKGQTAADASDSSTRHQQ